MALRQKLGWSEGDLMRSDAKPCSRLMRQTAAIFTVGGAFGFWVLCRLHYGPRITVPRALRWAGCGAVSMSTSTATLVHLFSPECEPQNIAAYDHPKSTHGVMLNRGRAEVLMRKQVREVLDNVVTFNRKKKADR